MVMYMKEDCLFCKIAKKEIDSLCLYEDDLVMVILDAYPDCDGHTLIIPKKHYKDIFDVDEDTLKHMLDVAKKYVNPLMEKLDKKSLTMLFNYGDAQMIKHIHLHLLPNFKKDKAKLAKEEVYKILMEN